MSIDVIKKEMAAQVSSGSVIVQLSDGLGNQLFQYAFAKALSRRLTSPVMLDVSWFPEFGGRLRKATPRHFGLGVYSLSLPYIQPGRAQELVYGKGIWGAVCKKLHWRRHYLRERDADLSVEKLPGLPVPLVIRGFYQRAEYAESVRPALLKEFSLDESGLDAQNQAMLQAIKAAGNQGVMVHVRRGDYLNPNVAAVHGACTAEYYRRAEEYVAEKIGAPLHLFVFSDDAEWVRKNYQTRYEMTVVDINGPDMPHLDINLMRSCAHAITANSTFSWWGAWLIDNPGKCVVAPASWFADGRETPGLIPPGWALL